MAYDERRPASLRTLVAALPARSWAGLALLVVAVLSLLQMHLVAARLTSLVPTATPWATTLVPLWLLDGLFGLPLVLATMRALFSEPEALPSDEERDEAFFAGVEHLVALIFFAMLLGSEIMLVQRLDGTLVRSFYAIAGPLYAGFGTVILYGGALFWFGSQGCRGDADDLY